MKYLLVFLFPILTYANFDQGKFPASGANTSLSNLTSTSLNQNLIFSVGTGAWTIRATNVNGSSSADQMGLSGGNSVNGAAGFVAVSAGDSSNGVAGDALFQAGSATGGAAVPGWVTIYGGTSNVLLEKAGSTIVSGGIHSNGGEGGDVEVRPGSGATDGIVVLRRSVVNALKRTADPCGDTSNFPEGSLFYNDTSNFMCFCNQAGADKKVSNETTDCF